MAQWNENTVPKCDVGKCSDEVLTTVEYIGHDGKLYKRVIKAVYFPYHHCTVEDMGWNMCDGVLDDWEYSEDKVIAWMKLPKPFNKKLKQLSEIELPKTLNPEVVK